MAMKRARGLKDRDFVRTDDGFFFCVIGYAHPKDRVISYLRYAPPSALLEMGTSANYVRVMPSYTTPHLLRSMEALKRALPQYVFYSPVLGTEISAVPYDRIKEGHLPEEGLNRLMRMEGVDPLQQRTIELTAIISDLSGVRKDYFGVTGSILIGLHHPDLSDIDLVVYGRDHGLKVKEGLLSLYGEGGERVSRLSGPVLDKWCAEKADSHPVTVEEAREVYRRKWNYGMFKGRLFSVHSIRLDEEITERYGDRTYTKLGMVKIRATISDSSEGMFLPYSYSVRNIMVEEGKGADDVREVITYDDFYGGIWEAGDEIITKGALERVKDNRSGEVYHRVLVGSLGAKGQDYIKPINFS